MNLSTSRAFVKERFASSGWERIVARLPQEDLDTVWETLILPTGWYTTTRSIRAFSTAMEIEGSAQPSQGSVTSWGCARRSRTSSFITRRRSRS